MPSPDSRPDVLPIVVPRALVAQGTSTRDKLGGLLFVVMLAVFAVLGSRWGLGFQRAGSLWALGGIGALVALGIRSHQRRNRFHTLRAGRAGLSLDDVPVVAREDVASAMAGSSGRAAMVKIGRRGLGGALTITVPDLETARSIVDALGLDARRTTAHFWAASRISESQLSILAIVAIAVGLALAVHHVAALFLMAIFLFFVAAVLPTAVVVGTDGVLVQWGLYRRFIPIADIEWVQHMPARVRLHLRSGRSYDVFFRGREDTVVPEAGLLAERVVEARARRDRRAPLLDPSTLARPVGTPARAWIEALSTIAHEGTFRQGAVTPEQLWDVVEDASLDAGRRAAAAVALRGSLDPRGRARLRVAAGATAAPQLRIALERAAGDDDAPLAEALDELARIER